MNIKKEKKHLSNQTESISKTGTVSEYEPPSIITYSEEDLLGEIGPIQVCSGYGSLVVGC